MEVDAAASIGNVFVSWEVLTRGSRGVGGPVDRRGINGGGSSRSSTDGRDYGEGDRRPGEKSA
jgi:hypothetical protein